MVGDLAGGDIGLADQVVEVLGEAGHTLAVAEGEVIAARDRARRAGGQRR